MCFNSRRRRTVQESVLVRAPTHKNRATLITAPCLLPTSNHCFISKPQVCFVISLVMSELCHDPRRASREL